MWLLGHDQRELVNLDRVDWVQLRQSGPGEWEVIAHQGDSYRVLMATDSEARAWGLMGDLERQLVPSG